MVLSPVPPHVPSPPRTGLSSAPDTLAVYVTEEIRTRIVLGVIPAGERVPLYALADELGTSRVPLREAVRQLQAEGLLDTVPRRGAVVRPLSIRDLEDCFNLLTYIEDQAAKQAAEHPAPDRIGQLRYWSERMRELGDRRVSAEMLQAHRNFHFALFDALGDGIMLRMLRILWHTCERYVMHCMPDSSRQQESRSEHLQLIDLVEQGDAAGASALLKEHIAANLEFCRNYLLREQSELDGVTA